VHLGLRQNPFGQVFLDLGGEDCGAGVESQVADLLGEGEERFVKADLLAWLRGKEQIDQGAR
jgi:hypothetical protein